MIIYYSGLTAYNHNLDTSREFYPKVRLTLQICCVNVKLKLVQVITTRSYDERLETIDAVRTAGISVCSGGILGLGESDSDRVGLIWEVSKQVFLGASSSRTYFWTPVCLNILNRFPSMHWFQFRERRWKTMKCVSLTREVKLRSNSGE